ncbi:MULTISPECIES: hypothetical protein [Psychrobacter]|uniref:hypothetical protein n=1 Tax=Psychrobacter TaxID=497 RepID=UPI003FD5E49C
MIQHSPNVGYGKYDNHWPNNIGMQIIIKASRATIRRYKTGTLNNPNISTAHKVKNP